MAVHSTTMEEKEMAGYRKLGRTSDQRKALIRNQVTNLLYHGKIVTTETRAKEVRKVSEGLIAMAVKKRDNFETVKAVSYTHLDVYKRQGLNRSSRFIPSVW